MKNNLASLGIAVLGGGAIGKLVTARLVAAGIPTALIVRRVEQERRLQEQGLVLFEANGSRSVLPITVTTDLTSIACDAVIVTVKSFDTEEAARQITSMPGSPHVLSLQNGLGNGEILARYIVTGRLLLGLTTYGATSLSDYEVAARGAGELVLGGYRGDHPLTGALSDIFSRAGWNVRIGTDMKKEVWKKALINIGINAVTAINRVANGDILANADLRETAVAAVREAGLVATALGSLSPEEVDAGVERMLEVCRATSANRSSMLQDVENHRQTEIDALNGAIVRWGEELSIATPVNLELVQRVKRIAGV